jgi:hypothetical protein
MKSEETRPVENYKTMVISLIIVSIMALLLLLLIKWMLINEYYALNSHKYIIGSLAFLPHIMQAYIAIMFPVNYHRLVKSGRHKHKLSHLLIPEISIVCWLSIMIVIHIVW